MKQDSKILLLPIQDYSLEPGKLILFPSVMSITSPTVLTTVVEVVPEQNTQLSGLYKSGSMYCTQCGMYKPEFPMSICFFSVTAFVW
jgi:hypothetical protein